MIPSFRPLLGAVLMISVVGGIASDTERSITYSRVMQLTETSTIGDDDTTIDDTGTIGIRCDADACALLGVEPEHYRGASSEGIGIVLQDGRADVVQDADGDPCGPDGLSAAAGRLTVAATAERIDARWEIPSVDCVVVGAGAGPIRTAGSVRAAVIGAGVVQTWTGAYLEGDVCLVDEARCPVPSETASAASGSSSPPATGAPTADPWAEESVLGDLKPLSGLGLVPAQIGIAALLAVVLVLLIAFPTTLLNSAIDSAVPQRRPHPDAAARHLGGWWRAALGITAAAVISGFVDPGFGVNETSVRVLLSILVAFVLDIVIGWSAQIWLMRRVRPGAAVSFRFVPLTLLIVAGAVALTRLTGFEPAIIFGLVAGVVFAAAIPIGDQARTDLVGLGYGFAVAMAAWVAYSLLGDGSAQPVAVFARETLAAAAIAGVAALPLVLFPLRGMPGFRVFRWRRAVWAAAYFAALFAFFVLLMPMPFSWREVRMPLLIWVAVYVVYCLVAVAAYLVVSRRTAYRNRAVRGR